MGPEPQLTAAEHRLGYATRLRDRLRPYAPLAALLGLATAFGLFTLLRTPRPFIDEANLASRAWEILQSGRNLGALDTSVFVGDLGEGRIFAPWLGLWFQSLAIRALGLSLLSVRLVSLAFGILLLVATYAIGNRWYGRPTALMAVALVSLSNSFLYSSHLARHDIMVAALGFGAVALYATDHGTGITLRSFLSGLAIGVAFEIHGNASIYAPVLVTLYLLDHGWGVPRMPRFWCFVAGAVVGLAFYWTLHLAPVPQAGGPSLAASVLGTDPTAYQKTPPILVRDPFAWLRSLQDTLFLLAWSTELRSPILIAAVALLLWRRSRSDLSLVALFAVLLLEFVGILYYKPGFYAILISPAVDLLVAAALASLGEKWRAATRQGDPRRKLAPGIALMAALAFLAGSLILNLSRLGAAPMDDYQRTIAVVRQSIQPDSVIYGDSTFWFGLADHKFIGWQHIPDFRRVVLGSSVEDALRAYQPDFILIDPFLEKFITDDPSVRPTPGQPFYMSKNELESILAQRGFLAASVETEAFGNVRLYGMNWE